MHVLWRDAPGRVSAYQTSAYGVAAAASAGAEWDVVGDEGGRWRLPVCLSELPDGFIDAASPYGYPGIHVAEGMTERDVADAWEQSCGLLADRGVVAAFLRFAPYREGKEHWHHSLDGLRTLALSTTIAVPTSTETAMWERMQGRARTAVRKAERAGLTADVTAADLSIACEDSSFRRVYDATMDRVNAAAQHRHNSDYYGRLVRGLSEQLQVASVRDEDGHVVASCLLLVDRDGVHYHLSGSIKESARLGANNLMLWAVLKWAASRGHSMLHLGGGTRPDDELFRFKSSFGGVPLPFYVGHMILRPGDYELLVSKRAEELGASAEMLKRSSFFPAYRAVPSS